MAAAGQSAGQTLTLRYFSQDMPPTVTRPDGTVITKPPFQPQAGDVLDVNSLLFRGNHRHHARRWTASGHVRCTFTTAPEPDCESNTAIDGSLLVFRGNPGTLVNGTGRFQGASGRVLSSKEVPGGSDVVARIRLSSARR